MCMVITVLERQFAVDVHVVRDKTAGRNTATLVLEISNRGRSIDKAIEIFVGTAKLYLQARRVRSEAVDVVTQAIILAAPSGVCARLHQPEPVICQCLVSRSIDRQIPILIVKTSLVIVHRPVHSHLTLHGHSFFEQEDLPLRRGTQG
jgi:hypothetical protein